MGTALIVLAAFLFFAGISLLLITGVARLVSGRERSVAQRLDQVGAIARERKADMLAKPVRSGSGESFFSWAQGFFGFSSRSEKGGNSQTAMRAIAGIGLVAISLALVILVLPFGSPSLALLCFFAALGLPLGYLRQRKLSYQRKFEGQFPEALDFLARALRAGHGLNSAIGMVSDELSDPVAAEFRTVSEEINFGVPFAESMQHLALRVKSSDVNFFVTALVIQRETGGNLAELLQTLAKTIRQRIALAGKVRVISAEGRLSGWVISVLPFALAAILSVVSPKYLQPLWSTPTGNLLLIGGLSMMAFGIFWITRVVRVRV
jgi:tight adherence protein B